MSGPPAVLSRLTDEEWHAVLTRSVHERKFEGVTLPGFPPAAVQQRFVGTSFERALNEAFEFYRQIKSALERFAVPLGPDSRVLDFGVGWGRILRYFIKDVPAIRLYGVDAMPLALDLCRAAECPGNLLHTDELPPTIFRDESFDLIYAFSVFSHLAERALLPWIDEFARILRPGGMLIVTSRGDFFLRYVASLVGKAELSHHEASLLEIFPDVEAIRARYAAGEFVFATHVRGGGGGLDIDLYGEAFVPRTYAERMFSDRLRLRDFIDEPTRLHQAVIVLQKP